MARALKYLWASPTTALGLVVGLGGRHWNVVEGVIEIHGGAVTWVLRHAPFVGPGGASAMTLGHVVIGLNADVLRRTRRHERVHVRQVERWGPLFFPAYVLASGWVWWRGKHVYRDNPFEVEAYGEAP